MRGATLALDIATTTGWALEGTDGYIASGTVSFKNSRYDGGGMRFLRFQRWLEQIDEDAGPIGAVYFEEVRRHVSNDSAQVHGGLLAVLSAWCEDRLVAYRRFQAEAMKHRYAIRFPDITGRKCLVPEIDGALSMRQWKDALWAKFFTGAPARQRQSVEQYKIVKRA